MAIICGQEPWPRIPPSCAKSKHGQTRAFGSGASATGFKFCARHRCCRVFLLRNAHLKFVCRSSVTLKVENTDSDFTRLCKKGQELKVIVAHGDGNYFASNDTLNKLEDNDQVAFRYQDNPNGSIRDIAGIFNQQRNVLGMMPHPEDAVEALHGSTDGTMLFDSVVGAMQMNKVKNLFLILALMTPTLAQAANDPPEWTACTTDNDCVITMGRCSFDWAINKQFLAQANEAVAAWESCDKTGAPRPPATT